MADQGTAAVHGEANPDRTVQTPRRFWAGLRKITFPYWRSNEALSAWLLLIFVIGLTLFGVYMSVQFNQWYNGFYNTLQNKDADGFWASMSTFAVLAAIIITNSLVIYFSQSFLQLRWRRWLTNNMTKDYLADRAYYRLAVAGYGTDNPDQRLSDDIKNFTAQTLALGLGILDSVVTLFSFAGVLYVLSGDITLPIFGTEVTINGYLLWACVVYALVGSVLIYKVGRPLIGLRFQQEHVEANFRFGLMRLRENAEGVALYRGEAEERSALGNMFAVIFNNFTRIIGRGLIINMTQAGYNQLAIIFPFLMAAPKLFTGQFQLGDVMQTVQAFGQVQSSLSFFVNAFETIAQWTAIVNRLTTFREAMDRAHTDAHGKQEIAVQAGPAGGGVSVHGLNLALPDGRMLITDQSLELARGQRVLVRGRSGSGKSTLFRALAGIWPFGTGTVTVPQGDRVLFLPQRPYIPIGTLREVTAYPATTETISDAAIVDALQAVDLGHLAGHLDQSDHWTMRLSGGEQQRLAIARALLNRPDWLFVDEGTSNLDPAAVRQAYALLIERLPGLSIVSISHDDDLAAVHGRHLHLGDGRLMEEPAT